MDFVVRVSTPQDLDKVSDLLNASYRKLMASSYEPSVLEQALPLITQANRNLLISGKYFIALDTSGDFIGCGGWSIERPGTGKIEKGLAHLRHYATHPNWSGRGIGRAIYSRCRDAAAEAGVRRFECYSSLNAERFYTALGFRSVRLTNVELGPAKHFPSIVMECDL